MKICKPRIMHKESYDGLGVTKVILKDLGKIYQD